MRERRYHRKRWERCFSLLSGYHFKCLTLQDKQRYITLSVKIKFICFLCYTDQKRSQKPRFLHVSKFSDNENINCIYFPRSFILSILYFKNIRVLSLWQYSICFINGNCLCWKATYDEVLSNWIWKKPYL